MAKPQRVVLVFNGTQVDVDLPSVNGRGCLRMLAREAEEQFGLQPGKYHFFGTTGKIATPQALQATVQDSVGDECVLQITESSDGKIMREMYWALHTMEKRVMAKMEDAILNLQQDLGSMVVDVAKEQARLRTKVDEVIDEALFSRTDLLEGHEELKARLEGLELDCLAMRADTLEGEHLLSTRLDKIGDDYAIKNQDNCQALELARDKAIIDAESSMFLATMTGHGPRTEESLQHELEQEIALQAAKETDDSGQDDADAIRALVCSLEKVPQASPRSVAPIPMAARAPRANANEQSAIAPAPKDGPAPAPPQTDLHGLAYKSRFIKCSMDSWSPEVDMHFAPIPYSSKAVDISQNLKSFNTKRMWQVEPSVPFAQLSGAPGLRACRSSPVLPPLK